LVIQETQHDTQQETQQNTRRFWHLRAPRRREMTTRASANFSATPAGFKMMFCGLVSTSFAIYMKFLGGDE
jgi:hypothetical protein